MAVYDWPDVRDSIPHTATLRSVDSNQRISESPLSGATQTLGMPGARWGWVYDFGAHRHAARMDAEAFLLRLSGREHRIRLWDLKRPRPRGTCNLSGVTVGAAAAQFATTVQLAGCGAGATLMAGDWVGFPTGQLVRVVVGGTANGSGVMNIEVRHMLRTALTVGMAVTLEKPKALFIRTETGLAMPRQPGGAEPGFSIEFVEVFS